VDLVGSKTLTGAFSVRVVMHGKDFVERVFVRVDVHHPTKDHWLEAAIPGIAGIPAW